jgi:hypothetical protein
MSAGSMSAGRPPLPAIPTLSFHLGHHCAPRNNNSSSSMRWDEQQ